MDNITLISHIYNEEFLLPFWLEHHSKIFKNGIIIDYLSDDASVSIIKKLCPTWKVIQTINTIDGNPNFDPGLVDEEVMEIEKNINNYKICLNTTEFLFINNDEFKFETNSINCYAIKVFTGCCTNDLFIPKNCNELFENMDLIESLNKTRGSRFFHNDKNLDYHKGRHDLTINYEDSDKSNTLLVNNFISLFQHNDNIKKLNGFKFNNKDNSENYNINYEYLDVSNLFIVHIANYNINNFFIERKLQIQKNIPLLAKINGFGYQHILKSREEAIESILSFKKKIIDSSDNNKLELIKQFMNKTHNSI